MKFLLDKLITRKHQFQKTVEKTQSEIDALKQNKLYYVNLFTDNVISKEEINEYRKLKEYENENHTAYIGNILKKFFH